MDGKGIFVVFVATLCFSVMMTSSASPDESRDTSSLDSSDSSSSSTSSDVSLSREDCRLRPIIHQLKYPGCIPKSIPSFACQGHCSSYVQVSGSKFWQVERSCMCCQESGEREATTGIFCPKHKPRFRKIVTRAPVECMCRPCTGVDEKSLHPQELLDVILSTGTDPQNLPSLHPSTKTLVQENIDDNGKKR